MFPPFPLTRERFEQQLVLAATKVHPKGSAADEFCLFICSQQNKVPGIFILKEQIPANVTSLDYLA